MVAWQSAARRDHNRSGEKITFYLFFGKAGLLGESCPYVRCDSMEFINKIILGDALEILPKIPKSSVDLVLTDPPYNISRPIKIIRRRGKFGKAKEINLDFGDWDKNKIKPYDWIPLVYPILKPSGVLILFYDKKEISCIAKWLEAKFNMRVRHIGVWIKRNPPPQARKTQWQSATEFFLIATKGSGHHYNWKEGQHPDYIITALCQGKERYDHPTQKPEALAVDLIKWWSFEGDIVLDPFCGTGTFPAVAYKLNRKFIGIEKERKYYEIARKRLERLTSQAKLTSLM